MATLVKAINSKLVEGDFDVNDRTLWEIETEYRKAEDIVKQEFPLPKHPDFSDGEEYSILDNLMPDNIYNDWAKKIKYELEQKGFVQIRDSKNIVELHTPTHKVYYKFDNQQILIYSK